MVTIMQRTPKTRNEKRETESLILNKCFRKNSKCHLCDREGRDETMKHARKEYKNMLNIKENSRGTVQTIWLQ